jgi:hypothetical protein
VPQVGICPNLKSGQLHFAPNRNFDFGRSNSKFQIEASILLPEINVIRFLITNRGCANLNNTI